MTKFHVLIIGNGHYATGMTVLSGRQQTDKDFGVLLPSVLALRNEGWVDEIGIAARQGSKLLALGERLSRWRSEFGWDTSIRMFPDTETTDESAYRRALDRMPRPLVALIAVPDKLHTQVMSDCIQRDVSFLVVKPAVRTLAEFYQIRDLLDRRAILAMVDYHKIYDEANLLLKHEYDNGEYGRIQHLSSIMTQRRDMLEIFRRWIESDDRLNVNHYLGSHYIHLVGFLTRFKPLDVRATAQFGVARELFGKPVPDLIETQIRWRDQTGHIASSYHVAGWGDPLETDSMTYQEIHLLTDRGRVDCDQRNRGIRKLLSGQGIVVPNPYFFNLVRDPSGRLHLGARYGFISVRTFLETAREVLEGTRRLDDLDTLLPTFRQSEIVTAILQAADESLRRDSAVVKIHRQEAGGGRYSLS